MKYNFITFISVLLISMTACVSEEVELRNTTDKLTVTATYTTTGIPTTKTTLTPYAEGVHVAWAENDEIRVMQANATTYTSIDLVLKEGAGRQTATFEGNNFPNIPEGASNVKYQAFYPTNIEGTSPETWKQNATYQGQIQKGYDNAEHLAAFDYMTTQQVDNIEQPLEFIHLGLIFCFDITMPISESVPQSFTLTTVNGDNTPTIEGGLFKNCDQTKTSSLTLHFQECTINTQTFKAYMMCNCNIPVAQKILATLTLLDGSTYTCQLTAQQTISSTQSNSNNKGISYIIPISEWGRTKNSIFSAETIGEEFTGTGTNEDPYIIESAENLKYLIEADNSFAGKYFSLATDITIQEGTSWIPIGNNRPFSGIFNGNGHTIKGELNTSSSRYMGLFGQTQHATINNLNSQINITNETCENIGGIVAEATSTTITNCHYNGNISAGSNSTNTCAGGIIAYANANCQVIQCTSKGTINQNPTTLTKEICLGGIIAKAVNPTISKSTNYTEIKGGKHNGLSISIGGFCGRMFGNDDATGKIEECHNYGNIYGISYISYKDSRTYCSIGGIVGQATNVKITHTYNHGTVCAQQSEHSNFTGGIIGYIMNGNGEVTLNDCANHGEIIGNANNQALSYTGGFIGTTSSYICKLHQCHNTGNVSVVTNTPENPNIFTGSYIGFIEDKEKNFIYKCCSTATTVIIKNATGEIIPSLQPDYYVGNSLPLIDCPDNHTQQNN